MKGRTKIGVFDSGVGGLTVLRALIEHIPGADYLYFGDTARLPYGSKSAATVAHYAVGAVRYLQDEGAELLVIACNTATALALDEIKAAANVEVIGVVQPGAEAAAAASRRRKKWSSLARRRPSAVMLTGARLRARRARRGRRLVRYWFRWWKKDGLTTR